MPGSDLAATPRDQTSGGGSKYGKVAKGVYFRMTSQKIGAISLVFAQWVGTAQSGHINPATPVQAVFTRLPRAQSPRGGTKDKRA